MQRNYQASANAYRDALNGDGEPKWTEVWSHIQLGKIFDVTGQRERAVRSISRHCKPRTIPRAHSTRPANTCQQPSSEPNKLCFLDCVLSVSLLEKCLMFRDGQPERQ